MGARADLGSAVWDTLGVCGHFPYTYIVPWASQGARW